MVAQIETIRATIEGVTPLLMHRFGEEAEASVPGSTSDGTRKIHSENGDRKKAALATAYINDDGKTLYMPGAAFARLLREAGSGHKQRGSRKSVKYIVPAAVRVVEDRVPLVSIGNGERDLTVDDIEVDSRPVTIPATKGRVLRHRARLERWGAHVDLVIDPEVLASETIHQLLEEGGRRIGIGDYRPERGGPFGLFAIVGWRSIE